MRGVDADNSKCSFIVTKIAQHITKMTILLALHNRNSTYIHVLKVKISADIS